MTEPSFSVVLHVKPEGNSSKLWLGRFSLVFRGKKCYAGGGTEASPPVELWNPSPGTCLRLHWERAVTYITWCGQLSHFKWEAGPETF